MEKNKCSSCGGTKCSCKNKEFTKAVIEIDNPEQITLMRKVVIPTSMGDDTTIPPTIGKYHNVLLYYEANQKSYLYSSDGIPTQLVNGLTDYEAAVNLPQINGNTLIGDKTGAQLDLQDKLTAGANVSIDSDNVISAVDTTYGPATDTEIGLVKPGDGLEVDANGTMSVSDIEQYAHHFDTVADMKAATNLINGSYAQTLGYSSINDAGAGLYKITNEALTADEGSIIALNGGLYATLIHENEVNVAQFGIDSTSTSNLANLVNFVNSNNINKITFNPISYNIDETLNINSDDITIDGNNCKITLGDTAGQKVIFNITADNTVVKNFNIYGNSNAQDQWNVAEYSDICDRRAFAITGENAKVTNVNIYNLWGCGLRFYDYKNVIVEHCVMDKIGGGFYKTDSQGVNDNFGDAIYLSGHNGVANVYINNVYCDGYLDTNISGKGSRGGVVLENLGAYTIENTNVYISNSTFLHFNRFVHEENYSVNTNIEVNNSTVLQDASVSTDYCVIKLNKCDITFTNKAYNGSVGFKGFQGIFTDCTFHTDSVVDGGWLAQGRETNHTYIRCTIPIKNNTNIVINGAIKCVECHFNIDNNYTNYLLYDSANSSFHNCDFNNSTNVVHQLQQGGSKLNIFNSTFNSIIPYFVGDNITNTYIGTTNTPSGEQMRNPSKLGMMTVMVDGSIVSEPNIGDVLPATNVTNIYQCCANPEFGDSSLPFMPTIKQPLKRSSRFIIVWCASDGDSTYLFNNGFDHGYYSVCTTDTSKNITYGSVTTLGNPGSYNKALTFDETNHTITPGHSSVRRVNYYVLPYEYLAKLRRAAI